MQRVRNQLRRSSPGSSPAGKPIQNTGPVPASTPLSETMSKELKQRGFKFVGPTIVYAWMQASGMVNDHAPDCFRREPCARKKMGKFL